MEDVVFLLMTHTVTPQQDPSAHGDLPSLSSKIFKHPQSLSTSPESDRKKHPQSKETQENLRNTVVEEAVKIY